ncbi:DUF1853 family protein [Marinibactrum halimedae]|nr:DUF1853 family protein [Marinibactrum halimedae]MCD9459499.1 DUF1853 family protein [Marinibactrum halimedae]
MNFTVLSYRCTVRTHLGEYGLKYTHSFTILSHLINEEVKNQHPKIMTGALTMHSSPFRHPLVRDLAWALLSPNLLSAHALPEGISFLFPTDLFPTDLFPTDLLPTKVPDCHDTQYHKIWTWLKALDERPQTLESHLLTQGSRRIGVQFEQLLAFYFQYGPEANTIADFRQRVQIHQSHSRTPKTIGELDFLWRCQSPEQRIAPEIYKTGSHVEAAVKFYMGNGKRDVDLQDPYQWVGPNRNDRLALKLNKLFDHQLRLSHHDCAQAVISALGIEVLRTYLQLKGRLFLPWRWHLATREECTCVLPDIIASDAELGFWLRFSELSSVMNEAATGNRWAVLTRQGWMSTAVCTLSLDSTPSVSHSSGIEWVSATDDAKATHSALCEHISKYFSTFHRPILIALLTNDAQDDTQWVEQRRYFVTPDDWGV